MNKLHRLLFAILASTVFTLLIVSGLALGASPTEAAFTPTTKPTRDINWDDWDVIPGRVLVTYQPARSAQIKQQTNASGITGLQLTPIEMSIADQYASQHRSLAGFISILPDTFVGEFDPKNRETVLQALKNDPAVVYFEPDRVRVAAPTWGTSTPNDPGLPLWGMTRIGAPAAWARQSATRANVRVAVMEGGRFDPAQTDLIAQNSSVMNHTGVITSHTTHVAGTIAATGNNGSGVVGVANVELVALAPVNQDSGFAQAISWAVNNQVRVINMSFVWCDGMNCTSSTCAYPAPSTTAQTAIDNAQPNIVFVAAAANAACNTDAQGDAPIPPAYNGVIGVSAIDNTDTLASFSNFGAYVDLTAPGVGVVSTDLNNTTSTKNGTSMASPHVAGSAAAILAIRPNYDIRSIPLLLSLTAEDIGAAGRDNNFGDGVVRADRATAAIADVYANSAQCGVAGLLRDPLCNFVTSVNSTPAGGTLGLVRGSHFAGAQTLTKQMKIVAVGGVVVIGAP